MLVLSRRKAESVMIGDQIEVIVLETNSSGVRLGFNAPPEVPIHRQEMHERIRRERQDHGVPGPNEKPLFYDVFG